MTKEALTEVGKQLATTTREYVDEKTAAIARGVARACKDAFVTRFESLERRLAELEAAKALVTVRVKALEDRPSLVYRGTWDASVKYDVGNLCTFSGSLWHAEKASQGRRPGEAPDAFRLVVKKGADGKNAR